MDILKQSIEAVITQGEQSIKAGTCQYKYDGLKCAVGHLITDEHYSDSLEGASLSAGNKIHDALNKSLGYEVSRQEIGQLRYIQYAHDNSSNLYFVEEFKKNICAFIYNGRLPEELREIVS
jgi:hypothetical protein